MMIYMTTELHISSNTDINFGAIALILFSLGLKYLEVAMPKQKIVAYMDLPSMPTGCTKSTTINRKIFLKIRVLIMCNSESVQ